MTKPHLLGISGSLRRDSSNTAILETMAESFANKVDMRLHCLADLPLYNGDQDGDHAPESVKTLKSAIMAADGIVFASPEYNYGMSGVLKNALDWASRPAYSSVLRGKPVLIITSSPGLTGGVRAQNQIRQTMAATLSRVIPHPEVVITDVFQKIAHGRLVDETTLTFVTAAIESLLAEITTLADREPA